LAQIKPFHRQNTSLLEQKTGPIFHQPCTLSKKYPPPAGNETGIFTDSHSLQLKECPQGWGHHKDHARQRTRDLVADHSSEASQIKLRPAGF
jgi:hypothetical protein